jgi:hypothetical protein
MAVETKKLRTVTKRNKKLATFNIDKGYLGSGIGALEECLRVCLPERHHKVNFYIGFAYKILRMPLKTYGFWKRADERKVALKTLSVH